MGKSRAWFLDYAGGGAPDASPQAGYSAMAWIWRQSGMAYQCRGMLSRTYKKAVYTAIYFCILHARMIYSMGISVFVRGARHPRDARAGQVRPDISSAPIITME